MFSRAMWAAASNARNAMVGAAVSDPSFRV